MKLSSLSSGIRQNSWLARSEFWRIQLLVLIASLVAFFSVNVSSAEDSEQGFTPSESFQAWVTDLVRDQLPEHYEKSKNWGHTKRVFGGWDLEREGIKVETRRKWIDVNDGTWTRYRITPLNPDKHLEVRVEKIEPLEGNKVRLELSASAKLRVFGRLSQWERGVQLVSLSAEADTVVRVQGTVEVALKLDPTKLPPDVYLEPKVTTADVTIEKFDLRRVGQLDGPLIRSLSDETRDVLETELKERRKKLVESLNKKLAKKQDKLKFSFSDLVKSEWGKFVPTGLSGSP
jgi:hypothetical protein